VKVLHVLLKIVGILCGSALFILAMWHLVSLGRTEEKLQACTRVLECLDRGASRQQCDELFPDCEAAWRQP